LNAIGTAAVAVADFRRRAAVCGHGCSALWNFYNNHSKEGQLMDSRLPTELSFVLDGAAQHEQGLQPLFEGQLESVAVIYGAHPFVIERVREALADPAVKRWALEEVERKRRALATNGSHSKALFGAMPESVVLGECWARDGLQSEPGFVPTEQKIEMIAGMVEAGFTRIEATSFAHPKYLPQFKDAEEVLAKIPRREGVHYRGICTTPTAIERAVKSREEGFGVDEIAMVISSSERHNKANVNMTHDENKALLEQMARRALQTGHEVLGWVLTSFGCPITGDVPIEDVIALGKWWKDLGARYIGFGDTTGVANPRQVANFYEALLAAGFTRDEVVVHFHDTRGWGVANTLTALTFGFRYVDSSLGAIGGQPKTGAASYHRGHTGNTGTEDLVGMLEEMGIETGVDIDRVISLGKRAEACVGRALRSNYILAGRVPHHGVIWDKARGLASNSA
jgi:hydroxymethylglutaryl-CoA lyase